MFHKKLLKFNTPLTMCRHYVPLRKKKLQYFQQQEPSKTDKHPTASENTNIQGADTKSMCFRFLKCVVNIFIGKSKQMKAKKLSIC